jgi:hypothetical protein
MNTSLGKHIKERRERSKKEKEWRKNELKEYNNDMVPLMLSKDGKKPNERALMLDKLEREGFYF